MAYWAVSQLVGIHHHQSEIFRKEKKVLPLTENSSKFDNIIA